MPTHDTAPPPRPAATPLARIAYGALLILLTLYYLCAFLQFHSINSLYLARFLDMVHGTASRPYVYRALVPTTIRLATALTPAPLRDAVSHAAARPAFLRDWCDAQGWERDHLFEYALAVALIYACIWGFLISLASLSRAVYQAPPAFTRWVCAAALPILPAFMKFTNYLYDPATLFLFTLGLALLARRRWRAYFVVYTLACINKETTLLLALVFWLVYVRAGLPPPRRARLMLAAQLAILVIIKGALSFIFRHNPGGVVERHLAHNLELLTAPAFPLWLLFWLGVVLLVVYRWRAKPLFLRRAVPIAIPILALAFFFGQLDEIRVFYEAYPVALLLAGHTCAALTGAEPKATC